MLKFVIDNTQNPSGVFQDFSIIHNSWRILKYQMYPLGYIKYQDIPQQPNYINWPDITSQKTLDYPYFYQEFYNNHNFGGKFGNIGIRFGLTDNNIKGY